MRIGFDATCCANQRGYGRFARELLRALSARAHAHELVLIGDRAAFEAFPLEAPNLERVVVKVHEAPTTAAAADGYRSVADMLACTRAVRAARVDVFFSPSVYTYFPLMPGQRAVVTVHDTIAERFPHLTLPSPRARLFWKLKVGLALRQARIILTVSDYAAREIERVLHVPRSRVRVAGEAAAAVYSPAAPDEVMRAREEIGVGSHPYFVYVGGFNPHKRVDTVIRAHAVVAAERGDLAPHLLLVGRLSGDVFHGEGERLRELVETLGTATLVRWTGFVPDESLRALHSGATAVVMTSESEGFGLPAVEGAACGAPVIATRESPIPELLPGGCIAVSPGNVEETAHAMRRLLDHPDEQRAMGHAALAGARALDWNRAADATLAALEEAAA